jgi:hypothetical protein
MVTVVDDRQSEWEKAPLNNGNQRGSSEWQQPKGRSSRRGLGTAAAPKLSMRLPTFLLFLFATFLIGRMTVRCTRSCSNITANSDTILRGKCKVWIQHRSHAEPKRLTLGCEKTWAMVKPVVKESLKMSTEKDHLPANLILLHPVHGKVDLHVPVGSPRFQSHTKKPLFAFSDDPGKTQKSTSYQRFRFVLFMPILHCFLFFPCALCCFRI